MIIYISMTVFSFSSFYRYILIIAVSCFIVGIMGVILAVSGHGDGPCLGGVAVGSFIRSQVSVIGLTLVDKHMMLQHTLSFITSAS